MIYEPIIGLIFTVKGYEKKMYADIMEEAKKFRIRVVLDQSNVTQLDRS